jgi:hypothetical protein
LNGICARFRGKAEIQNKITRTAERYNKQKGIELIYVQIKMKLNGLLIVSVNTQQKTTMTRNVRSVDKKTETKMTTVQIQICTV